MIKVSVRNEEFELLLTVAGWKPMRIKCKKVRHVRAKCVKRKLENNRVNGIQAAKALQVNNDVDMQALKARKQNIAKAI